MMVVRLKQLVNVKVSILVKFILVGKVIVLSSAQLLNASPPILITLLGIVRLVAAILANARAPILVTLLSFANTTEVTVL